MFGFFRRMRERETELWEAAKAADARQEVERQADRVARRAERLQRRQDRLDREHAQRDAQLALVATAVRGLEAFVEGQARIAEVQSAALMKLAEATQSQGEAFATWFKSFQVTAPNESTTVNPEQEWRDEQDNLRSQLGLSPLDDPESIPPEFRLALELQQSFIKDVRGDTRA